MNRDNIEQVIVSGRAFERKPGRCHTCAFSRKTSNTLTEGEKDMGCLLDAHRTQSCMRNDEHYHEVGRAFK